MIAEKTLAEFSKMQEARGWVYLIDDSPVVQIHFFTDYTSYSNGKPDVRYTLFWRTNNILISQLREWAKELVLMRSWQREEPSDPIQVATYYTYHSAKTGKYEGKDMHWFLFEKNLDEYDALIQKIHEKFLNNLNAHIAFASYTFDFLSVIILQADINSSNEREILINLKVPAFPKEFLKTVFEQTTSITVDPADLEEIMEKIKIRLDEVSNQP